MAEEATAGAPAQATEGGAPAAPEAAPAPAPAQAPPQQDQPDYWHRVTELEASHRALAHENRSLREQIQKGGNGRGSPDAFREWAAANPNEAVDLVLAALPPGSGGQEQRPQDTPIRLPPDVQARLQRLEELEKGQHAIAERLEYADFRSAVAANPEKYGIYNANPKRLDLAFRAYRQLGPEAQGIGIDQWLEASHQAQLDELRSEIAKVRDAKLFPELFGSPATAAPGRAPTAPAIGAGAGDTPAQRELSDDEVIQLAVRRMKGVE